MKSEGYIVSIGPLIKWIDCENIHCLPGWGKTVDPKVCFSTSFGTQKVLVPPYPPEVYQRVRPWKVTVPFRPIGSRIVFLSRHFSNCEPFNFWMCKSCFISQNQTKDSKGKWNLEVTANMFRTIGVHDRRISSCLGKNIIQNESHWIFQANYWKYFPQTHLIMKSLLQHIIKNQ